MSTRAERSAVRHALLHVLGTEPVPGRWVWRWIIRFAEWVDS